jgi:sortase (surface protein transpeptidase)
LAAGGSGLIVGLTTDEPPRPPRPSLAQAPVLATPSVAPSAPPTSRRRTRNATPLSISIPRIEVDARVVPIGVTKDNTLEVPSLDQADLTGWYKHGARPGEVGSAVIVGHVDTYTGPAVFFNLGRLTKGETIEVTLKDHRVAVFTVDGVTSYPKASFPTEVIYGTSDRPTLRLITCGGEFDQGSRDYLDNVVVFASLSSWK